MAEEALIPAGQIVIMDWREGGQPKEPNKLRPAIVVEAAALFAPDYPNIIVVPLTEAEDLIIPDLSVAIAPNAENGCTKPCWAPAHLITTASKRRINRVTASRITPTQLTELRKLMAITLDLLTTPSP